MTDEQRLQLITEQLIIVRDNLFRGLSKSMQKLQAQSINEVLELPNYTQSPQQRTWVGLTKEDIVGLFPNAFLFNDCDYNTDKLIADVRRIEAKLKEKNT